MCYYIKATFEIPEVKQKARTVDWFSQLLKLKGVHTVLLKLLLGLLINASKDGFCGHRK